MEEDSIDIKKENEFIESELKTIKPDSLKYELLLILGKLLYQMSDEKDKTPLVFLNLIYNKTKHFYNKASNK